MSSRKIDVVCMAFVSAGRVLAFKRSQHKSAPGKWEFPGGKVEPGESPESALVREIQEELSLRVDDFEYLTTASTTVDQIEIRLICYVSKYLPASDVSSSDHDEIRLVDFSEAMKLDWATPDLPVLAKLRTVALI